VIRSGASARRRRARSGVAGKCGIIRLYGAALDALRVECWQRDEGTCQKCGEPLYFEPRFDGDPLGYDMAHRRNKRMYGDTLENVEALCHREHMAIHAGTLKR
jgi:5-methylcytosine-specific restriction endonuclease McrA